MKRVSLTFICTVLIVANARCQGVSVRKVPPAVTKAFQNRYATVKKVEWKVKSDKSYEAEFTARGTDIAVKFDSTGKWLETESAAPRSTIPPAVQDTIRKRFKGYIVIEIQTVQRWNEQQLVWEIHLGSLKEVVKAQFSSNGTMMSRSTKLIPREKR
jgi:hypothetical protein